MLDNILVVGTQTMTLFLLIGLGFILGKANIVSRNGTRELSRMLILAIGPCLLVNTMLVERDAATLALLGKAYPMMFLCYAVYVLIPMLFFRKQPYDTRVVLRFGSTYNNVGFIGIPLVSAVLGQEAVFFVMVPITVFNCYAYTVGAAMFGGKKAVSFRKILLTPGIIAIILGFVLYITQLRVPAVLKSGIEMVSSMNTPLSMIVIGCQMSRSDFSKALRSLPTYGACALKLLVMPLVTAILLFPMRQYSLFYAAMVIVAAAPSASFTSMFAGLYRRDETKAAELITLSTLLSILTMPVFAYIAKAVAGI